MRGNGLSHQGRTAQQREWTMTKFNQAFISDAELDTVSGGTYVSPLGAVRIKWNAIKGADVPYPTGPLVPMTPGGGPAGGNGSGSGGGCNTNHNGVQY